MNEKLNNMKLDDESGNKVSGGDTIYLDDNINKRSCKNCGNSDPNTFYPTCGDLEMVTYHCEKCGCDFSYPRYQS